HRRRLRAVVDQFVAESDLHGWYFRRFPVRIISGSGGAPIHISAFESGGSSRRWCATGSLVDHTVGLQPQGARHCFCFLFCLFLAPNQKNRRTPGDLAVLAALGNGGYQPLTRIFQGQSHGHLGSPLLAISVIILRNSSSS